MMAKSSAEQKPEIAAANRLIDTLVTDHALKNDAALCRVLHLAPPVISKIRHGRLPVSDATILRIHEKLDVPVKRIRELLAA